MTESTWIRLMRFGAASGCHQMPERSFFIGEWQFPVCARCTGLPIGWLSAPIAAFALDPPLWVGALCLLPMGVDWLLQRLNILPSTNLRRFITGILGGFGYLLLLIQVALIFYHRIAYTGA